MVALNRFVRAYLLPTLVLVLALTTAARAQRTGTQFAFPSEVLFVGEMAAHYTSGAAKSPEGPWASNLYPGWWRYTQNKAGQAMWVATKDFTDENGKEWSHKISHIGLYSSGVGEVFGQGIRLIAKRPKPQVWVDGVQSFRYPIFYDEIDPDMAADARIESITNTTVGVEVRKTIRAFSQEYHDNYHVIEYQLTNTGNVDGDDEIELPDQTLEGVYLTEIESYAINSQGGSVIGGGMSWGAPTMLDVVGDDLAEYDVDFTAFYDWAGREPSFTQWDGLGIPALSDGFSQILEGDSLGRLVADHFIGKVKLHADRSTDDNSDDPSQPSFTGYASNGHPIMSPDPSNPQKMAQEYQFITQGHRGSWADLVVGEPEEDPESREAWRERMARQTEDPSIDIEGGDDVWAFGPYTLAPGESVTIVVAEAASGLSDEASLEIGKAYKAAFRASPPDEWVAAEHDISFDADADGVIDADESMPKNYWVMTSRDSLFQSFERAIANYESGYDIPQPPSPPREFRVTSGTDRIELEWTTYAEGPPADGFELYRTSRRPEGEYTGQTGELIAGIDELGADARMYTDDNVQRGVQYYYYLKAVGAINNDGTAMTPTGVRLKSNRAYTQTYDPATLKRAPGESLADVRIVPNPYNISSTGTVRWQEQDRIVFFGLPGQARISIYTETGELVRRIPHSDGSGDDEWNLTTTSGQIIVSGVYLVVIEDLTTGEQVLKKLVVVR